MQTSKSKKELTTILFVEIESFCASVKRLVEVKVSGVFVDKAIDISRKVSVPKLVIVVALVVVTVVISVKLSTGSVDTISNKSLLRLEKVEVSVVVNVVTAVSAITGSVEKPSDGVISVKMSRKSDVVVFSEEDKSVFVGLFVLIKGVLLKDDVTEV